VTETTFFRRSTGPPIEVVNLDDGYPEWWPSLVEALQEADYCWIAKDLDGNPARVLTCIAATLRDGEVTWSRSWLHPATSPSAQQDAVDRRMARLP
jgi:hypothetical protein